MKHLFVSYEIAKQLKDKGFKDDCIAFFHGEYLSLKNCVGMIANIDGINNPISAPLYQQVIDWFMEKHNIFVLIMPITVECGESEGIRYHFTVYNLNNDDTVSDDTPLGYLTYYETLNKAIEEAIKLLPE